MKSTKGRDLARQNVESGEAGGDVVIKEEEKDLGEATEGAVKIKEEAADVHRHHQGIACIPTPGLDVDMNDVDMNDVNMNGG